MNQVENMDVTNCGATLNADPLNLATKNNEGRDLSKSFTQKSNVSSHISSPSLMSPAIQEELFNAKISKIDHDLGFSDNSKKEVHAEHSIPIFDRLDKTPISHASANFPSQAHAPVSAPKNKP